MNAKEVQALESYFKTGNEHWNGYALKTIRKALEKQLFSDFNKLMQLYELSINIASESHREKPFEGLQLIISEYSKNELTTEQKVYLMEGVFEYLDCTEFDGWYSNEIQDLMKSQIAVYNNELKNKLPEYNKPLTGNIRDTLKEMMQKELEQLPETIKELDPVQRLNILCKLMPYVLPKTESVKHTLGEPETPKKNWWEG
jgi:predicted ATPase